MKLNPGFWEGPADTCDVDWIKDFGQKTWCSLWRHWGEDCKKDLPPGYDLYIVSYHIEAIDQQWLWQQSEHIQAPIVLLSDLNYYDWHRPVNVFPYTFYHWHHQLECLMDWFPDRVDKNIKYKASSVCNRITQSRLLIHTALSRYLDSSDLLLILGDWLEEKEKWVDTPDVLLNDLAKDFFQNHYGKVIRIDDFVYPVNNQPEYTGNPWHPMMQECALHFTNESYHYSYMQIKNDRFVFPGPFLTEKTLRCLVGGTAFVSVGQFDTYNTLKKLGLEFDYGLDLSFDAESGNFTRIRKIIDLIADLKKFTADDLFEMTKNSSIHNQNIIFGREFYRNCEHHNLGVLEKIWRDQKSYL